MSDAAPVLDRQSIDLLFSVIETPNAAIAGVVLTDYYGSVSRELQESGLLVPDGHEVTTASLADHDDAPVTLTWSDDGSGYGYFSSATGWVAVPNDRIARYRVNLTSFVERLLSRIDWPSKTGLIPLIPDTLWEIGDVRIEGRTKRIPVWIGRRLHDPEIWAAVQEVMRSRPAAGLRVIFASTATGRLPAETIAGNVIIAVRDVIDHGAGLAVDPAILAARIAGSQRRGDRPLSHSADYSVITVHGKDYAFTRKQRSVVRHLVEAFEAGSPRCLTAKVLEEAENAPSVNTLGKAFSGRTDWREFIAEKDGTCWIFV
jgi:hypothetical protein